MDSPNYDGETALHRAAKWKDIDVAIVLIENSADVNSADNDGDTPLNEAAGENSLDVANILLENSANLNVTAVSGYYGGLTPLQAAEKEGYPDMVELLKNA